MWSKVYDHGARPLIQSTFGYIVRHRFFFCTLRQNTWNIDDRAVALPLYHISHNNLYMEQQQQQQQQQLSGYQLLPTITVKTRLRTTGLSKTHLFSQVCVQCHTVFYPVLEVSKH